MNENIIKLFEKLSQDDELVAKMQACTTPDEAYAVASEAQDGFTQEEFVEAMNEINKLSGSAELSDEDLELVAGGLSEGGAIGLTAGICLGLPAVAMAAGALI